MDIKKIDAVLFLYLQQQLKLVLEFVVVLTDEYDALRRSNYEPITDYTKKKQELLQQIEKNEIARNPTGSKSALDIEQHIALCEQEQQPLLREMWQKLVLTLKEARNKNTINGIIIQARIASTHDILSILVHGEVSDKPAIYSARGTC